MGILVYLGIRRTEHKMTTLGVSMKKINLSEEAHARLRLLAAAAKMTQGDFLECLLLGECPEHNFCESVVQQVARFYGGREEVAK